MALYHCLSVRWVQGLLVTLIVCIVVGHLLSQLRTTGRGGGGRSVVTGPTTLQDPNRLQTLLNLFGQSPAIAGHHSERHRTEALCRTMLETMLKAKLPKFRPEWLMNPTTKRKLELDMYCRELKLAFEFDGSQHDTFSPYYHRNKEHFRYRRLLDRLKNEMCREAVVLLIRIPWHQVSLSDEGKTAEFLSNLLRQHHIPHRSLLDHPVLQ